MSFFTERKFFAGRVFLPLALFTLAGCSTTNDGSGYTFPSGLVSSKNNELTVYLESDSDLHPQWTVEVEGEGLKLVSSEYQDETHNEIGEETSFDITETEVFVFEGTAAGNQVITFTNDKEDDDEILVYTMDVKTNSSGTILSSEIKKGETVLGVFQN